MEMEVTFFSVVVAILLAVSLLNFVLLVKISSFMLKLADVVTELRNFLYIVAPPVVPPVDGTSPGLKEISEGGQPESRVRKQVVTTRLDAKGNVIEQEVENL